MAESLAERVRRVIQIRDLGNVATSQLGIDAGLSKDTVPGWLRKYETEVEGGRQRDLAKFARKYKVSVPWFVTGEGGPFGDDELERVLAKNSTLRKFTPFIISLARLIRDNEPGRERTGAEWMRVLNLLVRAVEPDPAAVVEEPKKSTIRKY